MVGNGDTASLLFFSAFLVTALAGTPSINAKLARREPDSRPRLAAATSILPFDAVAAGHKRLAFGEIGWLAPALGLVLWAALLHFHRNIFGVALVELG